NPTVEPIRIERPRTAERRLPELEDYVAVCVRVVGAYLEAHAPTLAEPQELNQRGKRLTNRCDSPSYRAARFHPILRSASLSAYMARLLPCATTPLIVPMMICSAGSPRHRRKTGTPR